MNTRKIRILGKTLPLAPLIAALIVGSVVIGYAANGFLTLIKHPVQQTTYHKEDIINIGDMPEYIEAAVTLEGEVNDLDEFVIGRPISVSLVIRSLREGFRVSDSYSLMIGEDVVLTGFITDLEMATDYTESGTWTPSVTGSITVALDIIDMVWTEYIYHVTFIEATPPQTYGISFVTENPENVMLQGPTTLLFNVEFEGGSVVDFDYTLRNDGGGSQPIYGWLYDIDASTDGQTTWIPITVAASVWDNGNLVLPANKVLDYTEDADFNAPRLDGSCEIRLTIYDIRRAGEGEPGVP